MLKTTARHIRDRAIAGDLGQPIVCSAAIEQGSSGSARTMFTVPRGQVLLITSVQWQGTTNKKGLSTTTPTNNPGASALAMQLANEAGSPQWTMAFMNFIRNATVFDAATPTAQSAEPGNADSWHPKYAIPVPGGFTVDLQATQGDYGNHGAVHGVLVDEGAALSMGYNVNASATKSRHGITVSRGDSSGGTGTSVLAGRPGKHIRILDMHVRVQPLTNTINTVELKQSDGTQFYGVSNANVVDNVEQKFSPDEIFLAEGVGIDIFSTIDGQCSVNIQYEFVDPEDVPANAFWGYLEPTRPTPGTTAVTIGAATGRRAQQVFTLFYPKLGTTKTSPTKGHQHLVRGVALSVQKESGAFTNSVQIVEQTMFSISHGAAASSLALAALSLTQANVQIIPTLFAGLHDQNVSFVDDGMNVACKKDDGSLWWQAVQIGGNGAALGGVLTSTTDAEAHIQAWHATIWGRTIANTFRDLPNRGD